METERFTVTIDDIELSIEAEIDVNDDWCAVVTVCHDGEDIYPLLSDSVITLIEETVWKLFKEGYHV